MNQCVVFPFACATSEATGSITLSLETAGAQPFFLKKELLSSGVAAINLVHLCK